MNKREVFDAAEKAFDKLFEGFSEEFPVKQAVHVSHYRNGAWFGYQLSQRNTSGYIPPPLDRIAKTLEETNKQLNHINDQLIKLVRLEK